MQRPVACEDDLWGNTIILDNFASGMQSVCEETVNINTYANSSIVRFTVTRLNRASNLNELKLDSRYFPNTIVRLYQ